MKICNVKIAEIMVFLHFLKANHEIIWTCTIKEQIVYSNLLRFRIVRTHQYNTFRSLYQTKQTLLYQSYLSVHLYNL